MVTASMQKPQKPMQLALDFSSKAALKAEPKTAKAETGRPNENAQRVFQLLELHEDIGRVQQEAEEEKQK
jgi:hypothetical protein